MGLRPITTVSRREDWVLRPLLWNRDTFEPYDVTDLTLGLALFREGDGYGWCGWWRDYGWPGPWPCRPAFSADSSDQSGVILPIPDDPNRCVIVVPQSVVAGLCEGTYRLSIAAASPFDNSVIEVLSDLVTVLGQPLASPNPAPFTGDSGIGGDTGIANNATSPT